MMAHNPLTEEEKALLRNIQTEIMAGSLLQPITAAEWAVNATNGRAARIIEAYINGVGLFQPTGAASPNPKNEPPCIRCSECNRREGSQHRPSCHRQGIVTSASDYRDAVQNPKGAKTMTAGEKAANTRQKNALRAVAQWNALVPVGSDVTVEMDSGEIRAGKTRSNAQIAGATAIVFVDGIDESSILSRAPLSRVRPKGGTLHG